MLLQFYTLRHPFGCLIDSATRCSRLCALLPLSTLERSASSGVPPAVFLASGAACYLFALLVRFLLYALNRLLTINEFSPHSLYIRI